MAKQNKNLLALQGQFFILFCILFIALASLSIGCSTGDTQADSEPEAGYIAMALGEDWQGVINELEPNYADLPPYEKLVLGHAYLAVNRNNDSLCIFMTVISDEELTSWNSWAKDLAENHPDSRIALYFLGDSYARLNDWENSLDTFNGILGDEESGLEGISPGYFFALNARGVVHAATGNLEMAYDDVCDAIDASPDFAEAYTNKGVIWIHQSLAATGADTAFDQALDLSPDYVLAFNGRGIVKTAMGQYLEAEEDFNNAKDFSTDECLEAVSTLAEINNIILNITVSDAVVDESLLAELDPAMAIYEQTGDIGPLRQATQDWTQDQFDSVMRLNEQQITWNENVIEVGSLIRDDLTTLGQNGLERGSFMIGADTAQGFVELSTMNLDTGRMAQEAFGSEYQDRFGTSGPEITPMNPIIGGIERWFTTTGSDLDSIRPQGVLTMGEGRTIDIGGWEAAVAFGLIYEVELAGGNTEDSPDPDQSEEMEDEEI